MNEVWISILIFLESTHCKDYKSPWGEFFNKFFAELLDIKDQKILLKNGFSKFSLIKDIILQPPHFI